MNNRDAAAAWTYHNATKHSYWSIRTNAHFLDWTNQPLPFKIYPTLAPLPLPREVRQTGMAALSVISQTSLRADGAALPDLQRLAQILYFSAGITRRRTYPGGEIFFRAAACTGALYEVELYLICRDLPDLAAGVYHFAPADFALRQLRKGDWRGVLLRATAAEPSVAHAPAIIVSTATYWRNAWKYQARTYRHFGWDTGTMLANMLALATAWEFPARVVCGFVDDAVNRLLDLDTMREVAFALVPIGRAVDLPPELPGEVTPLGLETVPLSKKEVDYPTMREMHEASSLHTEKEVAAWRGQAPHTSLPEPTAQLLPLVPKTDEEIAREPIERVILRRGSSRQFARQAITFAELSILLDRATRGVPADFLEPLGAPLNDLYLIVNAVEGLSPGAYFFHRARSASAPETGPALERLREGNFREEASHLGLEQELPGDASVAVFFLANQERILARFGNRGYRAVQLEAGILGGKLYLGAYALGLGATGLTFYDDDVTKFFSPHAEGKSAIFLVALGKSAKQKSR